MHLSEDVTVWHLTGDNSGYGPKFESPITGKSTKQISASLVQSDAGKDFNKTTVIHLNIGFSATHCLLVLLCTITSRKLFSIFNIV